MVPRIDLLLYMVTLSLSVPIALQARDWLYLGEITTVGLFPTFCFFLGLSCSRVVQTIKRVF